MAKSRKGLFGLMSGKIGNRVGVIINGKQYFRSVPKPTTKPPTQKQIEQRARFKTIMVFTKSMSSLFQLSFKNYAGDPPLGNAVSYNYQLAITGEYPDFKIEYKNVTVSIGNLPNVQDSFAVNGNGMKINFSWIDNTGIAGTSGSDKVLMVVHCPELNQTLYKFGNGRNTEKDSIDAALFAGKSVHTWLSFVTNNEKLFSRSSYTGELQIL